MREELKQFRKAMRKREITVYYRSYSGARGSEDTSTRDQNVHEVNGFTGDSCTLVIPEKEVYIWTDSRFFVQAEIELKDSGVDLVKAGALGTPSTTAHLGEKSSKSGTLAFYAPLLGTKTDEGLKEFAEEKRGKLVTDLNLIDDIWKGRPERSHESIQVRKLKCTGEETRSKVDRVQEAMKKLDNTAFLTGRPDEIPWVTNLHGPNITYDPIFLSYLMARSHSVKSFCQKNMPTEEAEEYLTNQGIRTGSYDDPLTEVNRLKDGRTLVSLRDLNYAVYNAVADKNTVIDALSPISLMKIVESKTKLQGFRGCHVHGSVHLTEFPYQLEETIKEDKMDNYTEYNLGEKLNSFCTADPKYTEPSFPTIPAYQANAAMARYTLSKEQNSAVKPEGLFLVDSDAHYLDDMTGATRTITLDDIAPERNRDYTPTAIGMLNFMFTVFPYHTAASNLDAYTRQTMWRYGKDFDHGTGHGVGSVNNIHELPVSVRPRIRPNYRREVAFESGMVTSDRPGVYVDGAHDIRIENILICVKDTEHEGFNCFENLTWAPLDPNALDFSAMSEGDIHRFNKYQKRVHGTIALLSPEEERKQLIYETEKIRHEKKHQAVQ